MKVETTSCSFSILSSYPREKEIFVCCNETFFTIQAAAPIPAVAAAIAVLAVAVVAAAIAVAVAAVVVVAAAVAVAVAAVAPDVDLVIQETTPFLTPLSQWVLFSIFAFNGRSVRKRFERPIKVEK